MSNSPSSYSPIPLWLHHKGCCFSLLSCCTMKATPAVSIERAEWMKQKRNGRLLVAVRVSLPLSVTFPCFGASHVESVFHFRQNLGGGVFGYTLKCKFWGKINWTMFCDSRTVHVGSCFKPQRILCGIENGTIMDIAFTVRSWQGIITNTKLLNFALKLSQRDSNVVPWLHI